MSWRCCTAGCARARSRRRWSAFASGRAQVLVATTVIEVGIDVPNATVMLIENAERFGISQLHQLRGRVGRGEHRVALLPRRPRGRRRSARLRALAAHSDGFRLAEIDLQLRSEGELVGTRQSGLGELPGRAPARGRASCSSSPARDAEAIVAGDPDLRSPEHALLGAALQRRGGEEAPRRSPHSRSLRWRMRVIAGSLGGRRLKAPPGRLTRPDLRPRARRRCSRCSATLDGARVLDLFAGSGALGIEALSRGADAGRVRRARRARAARSWRENLAPLGLAGAAAEVRRADALRRCRARANAKRHTICVFIDPPYGQAHGLGCASSRRLCPPLLAPGARIVVESDRRAPLELEARGGAAKTLRRHFDHNPPPPMSPTETSRSPSARAPTTP